MRHLIFDGLKVDYTTRSGPAICESEEDFLTDNIRQISTVRFSSVIGTSNQQSRLFFKRNRSSIIDIKLREFLMTSPRRNLDITKYNTPNIRE